MKSQENLKFREDDPTILGRILVDMGFAKIGDLRNAFEHFKEIKTSIRFGEFLVSVGLISKDELLLALGVQKELRSPSRHRRAIARADVASNSTKCTTKMAKNIRGKVKEFKRITGQDFNVITEKMLKNRS
jgi:hypothetical protein